MRGGGVPTYIPTYLVMQGSGKNDADKVGNKQRCDDVATSQASLLRMMMTVCLALSGRMMMMMMMM